MTLNDIQNSIRELGGQIRAAAAALSTAAANPSTPIADLTQQRDALLDMNQRMASLQAAYNAQYGHEASALSTGPAPAPAPASQQERRLSDILRSREYARAFARAIRTGARPLRDMGDESLKILYDALTISGGDPAGEDGGFLVPEDVDTAIRERRRELNPLADLFTVEAVSSNTGWRVIDTAPTAGMSALSSEAPSAGVPQDDQPLFAKVPFTLTTYGLIIPVSQELASDETANLFGYLANWFARKQVLTENALLKSKLETLTATSIPATGDAIAGLKSVLNKALDPAISLNAAILTNQDGFDYLDQLVDDMGRPMLQPDPTSATNMLFKGRPVRLMPNSLLPSRTVSETGSSKGDYYPIYVGDFTQFATLFVRQNMEILSTDIGGNAFSRYSVEVRGISRMGVSVFDTQAAVRREIFIASA